MAQSINLIPQQEQSLQHKKSIVKQSSVISILLLLIVGGVAGYYFYKVQTLQSNLDGLNAKIEENRKEIQAMSDMEVSARELDSKYKILTDLFGTRRRYSVLLSELYKRVPEDAISIESFSLSGETQATLNLSGKGKDYLSIAQFMDTLSDTKFSEAGEGLSGLFTSVTLNSVSLNNQDVDVTYYMLVDTDTGLLR